MARTASFCIGWRSVRRTVHRTPIGPPSVGLATFRDSTGCCAICTRRPCAAFPFQHVGGRARAAPSSAWAETSSRRAAWSWRRGCEASHQTLRSLGLHLSSHSCNSSARKSRRGRGVRPQWRRPPRQAWLAAHLTPPTRRTSARSSHRRRRQRSCSHARSPSSRRPSQHPRRPPGRPLRPRRPRAPLARATSRPKSNPQKSRRSGPRRMRTPRCGMPARQPPCVRSSRRAHAVPRRRPLRLARTRARAAPTMRRRSRTFARFPGRSSA